MVSMLLIVEKGMEGFTIGPKENKLGIRGSDTHSLMFTDVKVPKENRIGVDGFGFKFAMQTLEGGRIGIAAQALGIASGAYELALQYSKERKAFGKTISDLQAIQFKLADMATEIEARHACCASKAAWLKDNGLPYGQASSMAKLYASEVAMTNNRRSRPDTWGLRICKRISCERLMRGMPRSHRYTKALLKFKRIVISREVLK